jgi:hypothetical protein
MSSMMTDDDMLTELDVGGNIRELRRKVDGPLSGSSPPALAFNLTDWDAASVFCGAPPPQEWLVSGAIPRRTAGLVVAPGDLGKSFLMLELCLRTAGRPVGMERPIFGGLVQHRGAAVFVTAEDARGSVHRRMAALDPDGQRQARRLYPLYVVPLPDAGGPIPLFTQDRSGGIAATAQFQALREQLLRIPDLALVVLDPLQTFVQADINADPKCGAFVMATLNALAVETGCVVAVTHHARKEKEPPKNAQEARLLVRGSTSLVDQSRWTAVLWAPEERRIRQVCKAMGVDCAPHMVAHGAVVKSNDRASRKEWTMLRETSGLLRDVTADIAARGTGKQELAKALVAAIADAATNGRPYTRTGANGLFDRRAEMGEELAAVSKGRFADAVHELEASGKVVTALAEGSTTVKWLDVPGGPFARGEGAFAPGANLGMAGRKGSVGGRP